MTSKISRPLKLSPDATAFQANKGPGLEGPFELSKAMAAVTKKKGLEVHFWDLEQ